MQVKETRSEGLKREFSVVIPAGYFDKKMQERFAEVAKIVRVHGFRPGKVPVHIVKKQYGESVEGEVLEKVISESSEKVISDRKLNLALAPKIDLVSEKFEQGKDLAFSLAVELYPEVPEINFTDIKVVKSIVEPSEEDVEEGLKHLAESNKEFNKPEKPAAAKKGDKVIMDFIGRIDDHAFEGGTGNDFPVELGSGQLIDDFEKQLEGCKEGQEKLVKVTFPKEYPDPKTAGKKAEFAVKVKEILQPSIPEITNVFAKKLGLDNIAKLKEAIENHLKKEFKELAHTKLKKELFDHLNKKYDFAVPEGLTIMDFKAIGGKLDKKGMPQVTTKDEHKLWKVAERRVRLGMLLADIAQKQRIFVTEAELRNAVFAQARKYPGKEQQIIEIYQRNKNKLDELRGPILEDKVIEFLLGKVSVSEKKDTGAALRKFFESDLEV